MLLDKRCREKEEKCHVKKEDGEEDGYFLVDDHVDLVDEMTISIIGGGMVWDVDTSILLSWMDGVRDELAEKIRHAFFFLLVIMGMRGYRCCVISLL